MRTLVITGHRPADLPWRYRENDPRCVALKSRLAEILRISYDRGYRTFVSGMALGVDTWFAESVLELRDEHPDVRLFAYIPFAGQDKLWPTESQARYKSLLMYANEVHAVCQAPSKSAFLARNIAMLDIADAVLAVWDGTSGGTGHCVRNAIERDLPLLIVDPTR